MIDQQTMVKRAGYFAALAIFLALLLVVTNDYYLRIANMTGIAIIWAISLNLIFGDAGQMRIYFGVNRR